jgi:hypothetical protein
MTSLRFTGECRECRAVLPEGTWAGYDRSTRSVVCVRCSGAGEAEAVAVDSGVAGASALREYERRKTKRETRIREAHPKIGGLMLALSDDPQSTRAWQTGARGEVVLGRRLDSLRERGIHVLHDRRIPGTKANIDHIVVSPRGVFVIDAKKYSGAPSLRVEGGLFRPRVETLIIGSRDKTPLVHGVLKQVRLVADALSQAGLGEISSFGMMCFVEADWPMLGGNFTVSGVEVLWPRKAVERITGAGALSAGDVDAAARVLAARFPSA